MNLIEALRYFLPQDWVQECSPALEPLEGRNLTPSARAQTVCYAAHAAESLDRLVGLNLGFVSGYAYRLWTGEPYPYGADLDNVHTREVIQQFQTAVRDFIRAYGRAYSWAGPSAFASLDFRRSLALMIHSWVRQNPQGWHMTRSLDAADRVSSLEELIQNPQGECFEYLKAYRFFYRLAGFQTDSVEVIHYEDGSRAGVEGFPGHVATRVELSPGQYIFVDQSSFDAQFQEVRIISDVAALSTHLKSSSLRASDHESRVLLDRAISLRANHPRVYLQRSFSEISLFREGDENLAQHFQAAREDLERARQLNLAMHEYWDAMGVLCQTRGRCQTGEEKTNSFNQALDFFTRASALAPNEHSYNLSRAETLLLLGRLEEAEGLVNQETHYVQAHSNNLSPRFLKSFSLLCRELGRAFAQTGNLPRAAEFYRNAYYRMQESIENTARPYRFARDFSGTAWMGAVRETLEAEEHILRELFYDYLRSLVATRGTAVAQIEAAGYGSVFGEADPARNIHWARVNYILGFGNEDAEISFREAVRWAVLASDQALQADALAELVDVLLRENKTGEALKQFRALEGLDPHHSRLPILRARLGIPVSS